MTTVDRFTIYTFLDAGAMLNASKDETGRPGSFTWLPPKAKIISITSLPMDLETFPEGVRLLIVYRLKLKRTR